MRSNSKHTTKEFEQYIALDSNKRMIKEDIYRLNTYEIFEGLMDDNKQCCESITREK